MGAYEVTVGEFGKFVDATGYKTEAEKGDGCFTLTGNKWEKKEDANWKNPGFPINERHPVGCVSWNDAVAYAEWLKGKTGKGYRLPREGEWEYAARGGGKREKWAGASNEKELGEYAWYSGNSGVSTHLVGEKKPNELGLYDMAGNVWEWCGDWYEGNYYMVSPRDNPGGPNHGSARIVRGGSSGNDARSARGTNREKGSPSGRTPLIGFRLVFPSG
jgi:formylglycine-generating enzyme required for sulfatase activity